MNLKEKYDVAWKTFLYNQDMIKFADSKVKFLLAISGISTTVVITFMNNGVFKDDWPLVFLILFALSFLIFLYYALLTIYPRPKYRFDKTVAELIFFHHIANREDAKHFMADFHECDEKSMLEDLLQEIYQVANIASVKFKYYDKAWKFLILQIIMFLCIMIIEYVDKNTPEISKFAIW